MTIATTNNQPEIEAVLKTLDIESVFQPVPPQVVCDGIIQIDGSSWLVGTNDRGNITLHFLDECTKAEAWKFFHDLRGPNNTYINPRISFCGPSVPSPANN